MFEPRSDPALHYRLLKKLAQHPDASQRQIASDLGVSLGKVNYCLKALIRKGVIKVHNFSTSDNKRAYAYYLTPEGLRFKAEVTRQWFRRVEQEYEELRREMARMGADGE
ncbi:MAG: MarR family EPS-associated transcriptional regulator [Zetaproteobacteria bacterium]|nr:MAG: MarR family EPS-associated transcriptional regulator [Zetaproteobacteria bacterium]